MARNYNKVILVGNVGTTPELRQTKNGTSVTNFSVSTVDQWKNRNGEIQRHKKWHRIVCWGKLAETIVRGIRQGMLILVEGSISYRTYFNKENIKIPVTEIKATEIKKWANIATIDYSKDSTTEADQTLENDEENYEITRQD